MKPLLILLLFTITLYNCSTNDDSGDTLPPITQTGENTVGCLVNGKVFLPKAEGITPPVNCFYQFVDGEFFFSLRFSDQSNGSNEGVRLRTNRITLQSNETYSLNMNTADNGDFTGGGGEYQTSSTNEYLTTSSQIGELTIIRVDLQNSIISGTFWFDAINDDGEIVEIREGRFDWNY